MPEIQVREYPPRFPSWSVLIQARVEYRNDIPTSPELLYIRTGDLTTIIAIPFK